MKTNKSLIPFLLFICLGSFFYSEAKNINPAPDPADGKAVVTDYINAIGGLEAIQKISSRKDSGSFSIQGMTLPVIQEYLAPNKTLQSVSMNGMAVSKMVFNGDKGYQEQMGNHMDMEAAELTDMKAQTTAVPQVSYLTNNAYKLSLQGSETIDDKEAWKVAITTPSGNSDTEYYDKATKLLVKQVVSKTMAGQTATVAYTYGDYRKTGDVLLPYKQTLSVSTGMMNQSVDIILSDIKINEGVTAADFQ